MDNPNPIRYSDLITPDDSIKNLISQLDELITKYDAAQKKIQGSANEAVKSMTALSGATEEQREALSELATESDKLAAHYAKYNKLERDAYRLQQSVIQATKEQNQIDKLLVQIANNKEGSYNHLSAQYRLNKIRLNEMTEEQRKCTESGQQLERETRLIYEQMSNLQKATGKYTLEVGHYENALKGLPGPIGKVTTGLASFSQQMQTISDSAAPTAIKALQKFTVVATLAGAAVVKFVKDIAGAIKTNMEFEQSVTNLSTIIGKSRKEMENLTESALLLGRTTEYTASQVVELQTNLAKLGFKEGAIITMQRAVLQFATAVGADLGDAAQVAGATLRSFNLTSADTEDVLGTLAVATNNSALSFYRIRESMGTVFPTAHAFGLSIKDTAALLGALADAGFDASMSATATRNILLHLVNVNGDLAQSLKKPVKSFDDIIDGMIELRNQGVNLNETLELTDKRTVAPLNALITGAERAKKLRESLEDVSGELERIQKERLNTVYGSTLLLKSAWEGLTLSFRESNGAIKDTIDWLTKLITKVNELLFPVQAGAQKWTNTFQKQFMEVAKTSFDDAKTLANNTVEALQEELAIAQKKYGELPVNVAPAVAAKFGKAVDDIQAKLNGAIKAREILEQTIAQNEEERARIAETARRDASERQKELTQEQLKALKEANRQRLADLKAEIEAINLKIAVTEKGTDEMLQYRLDKIKAERAYELEENRQKVESERQDEAAINAKYDKQRLDTIKNFNNEVSQLAVQRLQAEQQAIQLEIAITEDGTQEMLALRLANIEKQRQIEIEQNKQKAEEIRQSEDAINAKYETMALRERTKFAHDLAQRDLAAAQTIANVEFEMLDKNERQKTVFKLEQEKKRLLAILELDKTATNKMTEMEIEAIKKTIEGIDAELGKLGYNNIYEVLGLSLSSEQQSALNTAIDSVKDSISSLIDSWEKAAEAAVKAADAQVEAAQKTLDAEIEARNQGYANSVETARKELELAKKSQQEALREKKKAQQAQLALDSIEQASSLVTATANLWKSFSNMGTAGIILASIATATMWGAFAAAKIKAAQVTQQTETYGEGTVELLEGGSHASGHDIDLGTKKDGTRRRAEGGEYFAVINKKNSRRYRNVIPDVINSFNNGTFADRYQKASAVMEGYAIGINNGSTTDVSGLERDVEAIRKQGDETRFVDGQGNTIIRYKNLTRKIKS